MISKNINRDEFVAVARDRGFSQTVIDAALDKNNAFMRIYLGCSDETCDAGCANSCDKAMMVQMRYKFCHLDCLKQLECDRCSKGISLSSEGNFFRDEMIYCPECVAKFEKCADCNHLVSPDDIYYKDNDGSYCSSCAIRCGRCSGYFASKKMYLIRGSKVCRNCGGRDIWVKAHDFNPLHVLTFQGNPKDGLYFGVELEIEAKNTAICVDIAESVTKNFGKSLVIKHDGSLADAGKSGLEIVSAPASFAFHKELWKQFFEKGYEFNSFNSERCSTHVHIAKQALKPQQIGRMAHFMYAEGNRKLIEDIAGRKLSTPWGQRYANITHNFKILDVIEVYGSEKYFKTHFGIKDETMILPPKQRTINLRRMPSLGGMARYSAINLTNPNTIEIRIFNGTSTYENMLRKLEFCLALVDYTRMATTSMSALNKPEEFKSFVRDYRSIYPNLFRSLFRAEANRQDRKDKKGAAVAA